MNPIRFFSITFIMGVVLILMGILFTAAFTIGLGFGLLLADLVGLVLMTFSED